MKNKKRLLALMLTPFVLSQSITALAAKADNNPTGDQHTTIGIMESTTEVGQASFEVPLYITTAAVTGKDRLICPTGYDIRNTSQTNAIGVVSVTVEKVDGGSWDLVVDTPTSDKKVKLTIGELVLPAVNDGHKTETIQIATDTRAQNTVFYDAAKNSKLRAIPVNQTLAQAAGGDVGNGLSITGLIQAKDRSNIKAAAQFRVKYVVSALDANGAAIGNIYVGDSKAAAGL